jgi:hypothetical protein
MRLQDEELLCQERIVKDKRIGRQTLDRVLQYWTEGQQIIEHDTENWTRGGNIRYRAGHR